MKNQKKMKKWLDSVSSETTKQRETRAAKLFNARRQPRSGASNFSGEKEDFVGDAFLYQHKETNAQSHTVKKADLVELRSNAADVGKNPVYVIDFSGDSWCMIPKAHFDTIREDYESE